MMTEELHVNMFCQITAGFSANVNNFPSPETTQCTSKDKYAVCTLTPKGKFNLLLLIFMVKIKVFIVKIKEELVLRSFFVFRKKKN